MTSNWDPAQYNRFASEREQPFWDLCSLLEASAPPKLVDLGCGDGRLTGSLHDRLSASSTLGIDSSPAMLAKAGAHAGPLVEFREGDISEWEGSDFDIVFSNAALQWVSGHEGVLARWTGSLAPGGQLAVQMPTNADHPSHTAASSLASEWMGEAAPPDAVATNVLPPERYALILHDLGFERQHVRIQVYTHLLETSAQVVEWVKGTSLTRFSAVLAPDQYERFVAEYRRRLLDAIGESSPYLYTFKRLLLWGRLP